jgi:hypothetical protein
VAAAPRRGEVTPAGQGCNGSTTLTMVAMVVKTVCEVGQFWRGDGVAFKVGLKKPVASRPVFTKMSCADLSKTDHCKIKNLKI